MAITGLLVTTRPESREPTGGPTHPPHSGSLWRITPSIPAPAPVVPQSGQRPSARTWFSGIRRRFPARMTPNVSLARDITPTGIAQSHRQTASPAQRNVPTDIERTSIHPPPPHRAGQRKRFPLLGYHIAADMSMHRDIPRYTFGYIIRIQPPC